jgi:hypothetical protein
MTTWARRSSTRPIMAARSPPVGRAAPSTFLGFHQSLGPLCPSRHFGQPPLELGDLPVARIHWSWLAAPLLRGQGGQLAPRPRAPRRQGEDPVDPPGGPPLRRLSIPRRVLLHGGVAHHPAGDGMAAVDQRPLEDQPLQLACGRRERPKPHRPSRAVCREWQDLHRPTQLAGSFAPPARSAMT